MKDSFFEQLDIPLPEVDLGVGSGSHAVQTAEIMKRFEPELDRLAPQAVLVVGDVNSTIACALVAVKKGVPVVHVEAGLRSFDRAMPEEINRVLTGPDRRPPVHDRAGRRAQLASRGGGPGEDPLRRQRHDRHAALQQGARCLAGRGAA